MSETAERWHRVDEVFSQALDLPPAERPAFLAEACGDDDELRSDVERLLLAAESGEDPLLRTGGVPDGAIQGALLDHPLTDAAKLPADRRIGPFRVLDEIGRGGMGVVYRAERIDGQFEQQVALKLLQRTTEDPVRRSRFAQERQILATLDHPNIARLLDGGVTGDGRPYFAMELIDGRPIDRYCDRERLTIEERLRLFIEVGHAVESAHRQLVVHRDLKPSNILVDRDRRVKLLDFGIAKLLDPGAWETPETRTVAPPMTPEYASPEQVRGEPITTASDVYQLGVLLYGLLTGLRPYRSTSQGTAGWVYAICKQQPTRPSAAVASTGDPPTPPADRETTTVTAISEARRTRPRRLRQILSGDLDSIVLKALRKEPEHRYASVAHLVEDVKRYLAGHPVRARRGTLVYRARKLLERHAAVATSLGLALLTVVALVAFYTTRLAAERDRAERQARRAERTAELLASLFEGADPYLPDQLTTGPDTTARELLDRGARRLESELDDEPEVRADMMEVIGDVYRKIALYDASRPLLEQALDSRLEQFGEKHPETAQAQVLLGKLLLQSGDATAARQLFEKALATQEEVLGTGHPRTLATLTDLASAHRNLSELDRARELFEEALARHEEALAAGRPDSDPLALAETLEAYGQLLKNQRAYREAIGAHRRALEIREAILGPEHPRVGQTLRNLGTVVRYADGVEQGLPYMERAVSILEKALGPNHPSLADALSIVGLALRELERFDEAERAFERSLEIRQAALGDEHPLVAESLNSLALNAKSTGRFDRSRELYERTIAVQEAALGRDHGDLAPSLTGYAELLHRDLGDAESARPVFERVVELRIKNLGAEHSFVALALHNLTRLLVEEEEYAEALPLLERALAICRDTHRPGHWITLNVLFWLTESLTHLERYEEAEPYALEAWSLFEQSSYFEAAKAGGAEVLIDLYESWGKPEKADAYRVHL